jgi:hypothetical protein
MPAVHQGRNVQFPFPQPQAQVGLERRLVVAEAGVAVLPEQGTVDPRVRDHVGREFPQAGAQGGDEGSGRRDDVLLVPRLVGREPFPVVVPRQVRQEPCRSGRETGEAGFRRQGSSFTPDSFIGAPLAAPSIESPRRGRHRQRQEVHGQYRAMLVLAGIWERRYAQPKGARPDGRVPVGRRKASLTFLHANAEQS